MDVPFGGGCACGAIRYECAATPIYMGNCHCTHCQQATGGASMPVVVVKAVDFTLLSGEPNWFERPSDGGHPMRRAFCPVCGSPLFLTNGAHEGVRGLYAGSLDDASWYKPSREIYVTSAQPWALMDPDLPMTKVCRSEGSSPVSDLTGSRHSPTSPSPLKGGGGTQAAALFPPLLPGEERAGVRRGCFQTARHAKSRTWSKGVSFNPVG